MLLAENNPLGGKKRADLSSLVHISLDGAHHRQGCEAAFGATVVLPFGEPRNPLGDFPVLGLALQKKGSHVASCQVGMLSSIPSSSGPSRSSRAASHDWRGTEH